MEPVLAMPTLERWVDGTLLEKTMRESEAGFEDVKLERLVAGFSRDGLRGLADVIVQNFESLLGSQWDETEKVREATI